MVGVDNEAVVHLRRVVGRLARHLNAEATGEGLTPSQASVLGQIVVNGPLGVGRLSQIEGLNPTMLSRVIGKLDQSGLIVRRQGPDDLRAVWVECTPAGRRLSERIRKRRTETLSRCVERLPAGHAQSIVAALPALEALVSELERLEAAEPGRRAPQTA